MHRLFGPRSGHALIDLRVIADEGTRCVRDQVDRPGQLQIKASGDAGADGKRLDVVLIGRGDGDAFEVAVPVAEAPAAPEAPAADAPAAE